MREEPVSPSALDPEVSPAIDAITAKALAKSVDERYQSATEMRDDIERALEGRAVVAPPVDSSAGTHHFFGPAAFDTDPTAVSQVTTVQNDDEGRRRRTGLWALLLLLLAALAAAAFFVVPQLDDNEPQQVKVPDLQGMTRAEAKDTLEDVGLELGEQKAITSDRSEINLVLSQEPNPLQLEEAGTEVDIEYGAGPDMATIPPDITDKTLAEAKDEILTTSASG